MEYSERSLKGYEIEHIWANKPERYEDEVDHSSVFESYRNRIGGLLVLPKKFNASFGILEYNHQQEPKESRKSEHYLKQNLLEKSLNEICYSRNPDFLDFINSSELKFRAHQDLKRADLDARGNLY